VKKQLSLCLIPGHCINKYPGIKSIPVSSKKSFVIRIDNETYKALEKWAADEFRSVNGQIEWILSQKLKETGRSKDAIPKSKDNKTNS
jgi:hypothetical protein